MELKLPGDKLKSIQREAKKLQAADQVTALELSRLLGKMNAAIKAIAIFPHFYHQLQAELQLALNRSFQYHNTQISLSQEVREELLWWTTHFTNWNGQSLISKKPEVSLETDASRTGWGAVCQGVRTGGPWSKEEIQNAHQLPTITGSVPCLQMLLQREEEHQCPIENGQHLSGGIHQQDGRGSVPSFEQDKQRLPAVVSGEGHLRPNPASGGEAEQHSRCRIQGNEGQIRLDALPSDFHSFKRTFGPLEVDLFALRFSTQLPTFVSWRPDPEAMDTDAFTRPNNFPFQNWPISVSHFIKFRLRAKMFHFYRFQGTFSCFSVCFNLTYKFLWRSILHILGW